MGSRLCGKENAGWYPQGMRDLLPIAFVVTLLAACANPTPEPDPPRDPEIDALNTRLPAAIVAEDHRPDPIAKGDLIRNPLFDRDKSPKFYLLGRMPPRWPKRKMVNRIGEAGGQVLDRIEPSVDFVVLGRLEGDSAIPFEDRPEWERIENFNLETISPTYLAEFLRR